MKVFDDGVVEISHVAVGPYDNNVYVVRCAVSQKSVLIDAAAEAAIVLEACAGSMVEKILITHGHSDHIGALSELQDALGVEWSMHPDDIEVAGVVPDTLLAHGQEVVVGELAIHVLHTPGHTPGSVSFVIEPVIFSGDTLFPGGPGATRWEYSSFGQIMDSIEKQLFLYPDPTLVYPGHGLPTTLGDERPNAPEWRKRGW